MARHKHKRFWQIGCLGSLSLAAAVFLWLLASTSQKPTTGIITQRTVLALHGPLHSDDEGVKALWEALLSKWQSERTPAWQVLNWLGIPREVTISLYSSQPTPSSVFAVNFAKGYRVLWLILRIFGKHYRGAHYVTSHHLIIGMYGGTAIVAEDEATFRQAIDNFALARKSGGTPLKIASGLRNKYDFVGFINPQFLDPRERTQLPANLGEIGIDIIDANELIGSVFWVCQSEREAEGMMRALEKVEKEMATEYARLNVRFSFRKQRERMFVWWEFRLTNYTALLF